ncbi:MAG: sulfurtransferase TusA family protein [Ectothiorhodospiraceae bacterium]|nr:sulfurtransferase TusA family protein [Ectothiorhodospiraceae bacterium]
MQRQEIDARGLLCPMPVIRLQQAAPACDKGDELDVLATDPGVRADIPAWCRVHGHEVVEIREEGYTIRVRVRIGG